MSLSYPPSCLQVINVSKTYRVFDTPSQRLKDLIGLNGRHQDVVALQNTSFSLVHGETVAIVGANGSGKSTLLQLICGTLTPSTGTIKRHGRIAALLELGAGFNPEFTGLENVFLNASINGLTQEQTEAILPDILAFADIGEHVYQPVKTYSSGMYVRLAFAVAIHVEPDILIIDEALAVGDEAFQRKCFARLRDLQSRGVSILFVSHSAESVVSLCDRALLLDHGQLLLDGPPRQVVAQYQKLLYARPEQREQVRAEIRNEGIAPQPVVVSASEPAFSSTPYHPDFFVAGLEGDETDYVENGAVISSPMLLDSDGYRVNLVHKGAEYRYCYQVKFLHAARDVFCSTLLKRVDGVAIGGMCSSPPGQLSGWHVSAQSHIRVEFRFRVSLNAGTYFFNAGVQGAALYEHGFLARKLDALMFKVLPTADECSTGNVDFGLVCKIFSCSGSALEK